jgi:hypothetical protein
MKLIANKESYGFLGRHWLKGDVDKVEEGTKFPEHFDRIDEGPKAETPMPEAPKKHKKQS